MAPALTAVEAGAPNPRAFRGDELVPWSVVARRLGRTPDTLKSWADKFGVPALKDPGGEWLGYQSWIDAVLASVRPGQRANIADTTRQWWAARGIELEGVA